MRRAAFLVCLFAVTLPARAQATRSTTVPATQPAPPPPLVRPYIDPSQFDCPWPKHDHYKQPWRAFVETRSGYDFLNGVGVVYNEWSNPELTVRLLAETGFKTFRMEIPFGDVEWDEKKLRPHDRDMTVFRLCKQYGIRPTILLNAHHGVPCPMKGGERKLAAPAKAGDRTIRLADVSDLRPHYSGLSNVTEFWAVQIPFTQINPATGECKLGKPLPKDLPADKPVLVNTLKYRPLMAVNSREYDETVDGWLRYVAIVIRMLREAGVDGYDLEIWNELTFGSHYLDADRYYSPPLVGPQSDALRPGGRCWELGRRTVELAKLTGARDARVLWGFSNTTFYHTQIEELPAGIDGQSYHPYGTGTRQLEFHEQHKDNPGTRQGPPPPVYDMRLPEGYAITWIQTECLLRLTGPQAAGRRPRESRAFYHYITEHGVLPAEMDVTDPAVAARAKSKAIIRALVMWLNKRLDVLHWYSAGEQKTFGILPADIAEMKPDVKFDEVASPAMKAVRNLTRGFAGAVQMPRTTQLTVDAEELTPPRRIWEATKNHPPLWERQCFAVLPFQLTPDKFVVPVYVMTYDVVQEHPGSRYRVTLGNLPAGVEQASYDDPLTGESIPIQPTVKGGVLEVELPVVDYPRLLTIQKK
jgi:hypothetical protein